MKKTIPILDLEREYSVVKKEIDKELKECFRTHAWILGPKVREFEKKAALYLGSREAIGVASGTDALLISLNALALKRKGKEFFDKKDEIITTPFTFVATAESIVRAGATPVFVDVGATIPIHPIIARRGSWATERGAARPCGSLSRRSSEHCRVGNRCPLPPHAGAETPGHGCTLLRAPINFDNLIAEFG